MLKLLLSSIICTGLAMGATNSLAADMSVPESVPDFSWTGLYVGADVGFRDLTADVSLPGLTLQDAEPSPDALSLGGEIGYRYQFDNQFVVGLAADAAWLSGADDSDEFIGIPGSFWRADSDWTASVQASLGFAFDRALIYGTGGVAFTDISGCGTFGASCVGGTEFSGTHTGWTVGAGLAYALTDNWAVNVEYHYADFGSETYNTPSTLGGVTKVDMNSHAASFGIQYLF